MAAKRILIESSLYLGEKKDIFTENCVSLKLNNIELKKLIDTCNETGLNMSEIIRLHTQKCCNCPCTSIQYYDKASGALKTFKKVSFLSHRKRNYFTKRKND